MNFLDAISKEIPLSIKTPALSMLKREAFQARSLPACFCFAQQRPGQSRTLKPCSGAYGASFQRSSYLGKVLSWHNSGQQARLYKVQKGSRRLCQEVKAAIFGVGAPEALLVGVVALVVFGPKGLAQAVKSLGATLKTFSPTIRELANVSNELSSTLREQIGIDDIRNEFRNPPPAYRMPTQNDSSSTPSSSTENGASAQAVEDMEDENLEAKIEESKRLAWGDSLPDDSSSSSPTKAAEEPSTARPPQNEQKSGQEEKSIASDFSIEELEAELRRRKEAAK